MFGGAISLSCVLFSLSPCSFLQVSFTSEQCDSVVPGPTNLPGLRLLLLITVRISVLFVPPEPGFSGQFFLSSVGLFGFLH